MKHFIVAIFALLLVSSIAAQEGGIQFNKNGKWSDILAQAKAENKLIFMDAYAVWCGPCKMMENNVFSQAEVGNYFNKQFINVQMDMEKGEGVDLSQFYAVQAYPTFLFIDGDGKVAHRAVGYHESDDFLDIAHTALDPNKRLSALEARFDAGDRDPQFMSEVMTAFENAMHPRAAEVADAFLSSQSDWSTPTAMEIILNNLKSTDSKQFQYLLKNRTAFEKAFGEQQITNIILGTILNESFAGKTEMPSLEEIHDVFKMKVPADLAEKLFALTKMNYYRTIQDVDKYAQATVDYYKKYPSDDFQELNEIAWSFYQSVDDKNLLGEALKWAEHSVELNSIYFNNDTLAALYYKLGKQKQAKKAAEKAIEIAKASGEDYSETEELLKQINKM